MNMADYRINYRRKLLPHPALRLQRDEAEVLKGTSVVIGPLMAFCAISALSLPDIIRMIFRACIMVLIPMDRA